MNIYDIKKMIQVVDLFLNETECDHFINEISNKQLKFPFSREALSETDKYTDKNLADFFYNKFMDRLNDLDKKFWNSEIIGSNDLIMTSKYSNNGEFGIHTDTGLLYDPDNNKFSRYTALIYLNDNFKGGETIFYNNDLEETKRITPKKGSLLVFNMSLFHSGSKVIDGNKYWIGCEFIGNRPLF